MCMIFETAGILLPMSKVTVFGFLKLAAGIELAWLDFLVSDPCSLVFAKELLFLCGVHFVAFESKWAAELSWAFFRVELAAKLGVSSLFYFPISFGFFISNKGRLFKITFKGL